MPINAFGGGPGSGKTYGVMEHVLLPAVAQGRFILTNIEGLNLQAIYDYVVETYYKGKIICVGHIRICDRNAPFEDDFFPGEDALDKPMDVPSPGTDLVPRFGRVIGGDLVVIDEATRYWVQGEKVKPAHQYFFREHRHFANVMGHTCDLVVIDPDLGMLARALKGKIEMSSVTHKPKEVGMNRYTVKLFRGARLTGKPQQTLGPYAFQKKIYSLYKSYSHEKAKEQKIDGRQNALMNPRLWALGVFLLCLLGSSIWFLVHFFKGRTDALKATDSKPAASSPLNAPVGPSSAASAPKPAEALRISGEVQIGGSRWVSISDGSGRVRLVSPAGFSGRGVLMVGSVDGKTVEAFMGSASPASPSVVSGVAK